MNPTDKAQPTSLTHIVDNNYFSKVWSYRRSEKITARVMGQAGMLLGVPISAATTGIDIALGLISRVGSFVTGGKVVSTHGEKFIKQSKWLLFTPVLRLIQTFNINAMTGGTETKNDRITQWMGTEEQFMLKNLSHKAIACMESNQNWISKNIFSRLNYALFGITSIVVRTAQAALACLVTPVAVLSFGISTTVNKVALHALLFPTVINEVSYALVKFVNPWAKVNYY